MKGSTVVRRYRLALANADYETAFELLHPNLSFYPPKQGLVFGRDDLRGFWSQPEEEYEHLTSEVELGRIQDFAYGRCFSTTREIMRWRETGEVAATIERAAVWTLDEDKIVAIRVFSSSEAARAAIETTA